MGNPVGWFEIYVADMARARRFYETMLGVTLERLDNPLGSPVELWGRNVSVNSVAQAAGTIAYELLCNVKRVRREIVSTTPA